MATEGSKDFVRIVISYFIPPAGVFMQRGIGSDFWINLLLSFFGFFPGVIHAIWVICKYGPDGEEHGDPTKQVIKLLAAAWLPPLGVFMHSGMGKSVIINAVLTALFWIPGVLHAVKEITSEH